MRVKTEMMFRNELGKLEDAKDSDLPGWPITSVTPELWEKIVKRKWISPKIDAHGQLFSVGIGAVNGHYMEKYVFWQYGAPVASVIDSAFEQSANIRELSNIKKNMEGFDWSQEAGDLRNKAARTPEEHVAESKAEALIFKITCWAAEKTGMHHRFSAEYCLAMALTEHYALLERHFPVFARLRELSKLLAVVRLMNAVHEKANTDADLAPIRKSFDHFRLSKSRKIEVGHCEQRQLCMESAKNSKSAQSKRTPSSKLSIRCLSELHPSKFGNQPFPSDCPPSVKGDSKFYRTRIKGGSERTGSGFGWHRGFPNTYP